MENDPAVIDEILRSAKTVAVVGMSDKPHRASYNIGRYLAANGYRVLPVNPQLTEIDGGPCYPDLDAAQAAALALPSRCGCWTGIWENVGPNQPMEKCPRCGWDRPKY